MSEPATPTTENLTPEQKLEYEEIGRWCRHDDDMIYKAAAFFMGAAFGALPIASGLDTTSEKAFLCAVSLLLYFYWWLISARLSWFSSVRLTRAREIEAASGLSHHVRLKNPPAAMNTFGRNLSIRKVRICFGFVLVVAWVVFFYFLLVH